MRKITKNQFHQKTTRRRNPWTIALDDLKVGEALVVQKKEYRGNTLFNNVVSSNFCKRTGPKRFKVRLLKDKTAWGVLRIK